MCILCFINRVLCFKWFYLLCALSGESASLESVRIHLQKVTNGCTGQALEKSLTQRLFGRAS